MFEFEIKPYNDEKFEGQLNMKVGEDSLSIEGILRIMELLDWDGHFAEYKVFTENRGLIYHYVNGKTENDALMDIFESKLANGE